MSSIPPDAERFNGKLGQRELLNWRVNLYGLTEAGEEVDAGEWTLAALPEATALGLDIVEDGVRDAVLAPDNRGIIFWLAVDDEFYDNVAWDDGGTLLPLRVSFDTTADPYRSRERTFLVAVGQQ